MITNEDEVRGRMDSPMNLLNRLRSVTNKHKVIDINGNPANIIPSLPPTATEVIENLEEKLKFGSIKTKAAGIMVAAMDQLQNRIAEVDKPEALAKIAETMSKVVTMENANTKEDKLHGPQFVLYAPTFNNETHYETIHARE